MCTKGATTFVMLLNAGGKSSLSFFSNDCACHVSASDMGSPSLRACSGQDDVLMDD